MTPIPTSAPTDLVMPASWQLGTLILTGGILLGFSLLALWNLLRRRDPLLFFCLVGGTAAVMLEPITNVLGLAYHPERGQIVGYEFLGRGIPLHIAMIYPWYFGAYSWALIRAFESGISRTGFWKIFGCTVAFAFLIEVLPVKVGLWRYYGEQPLNFYGMPLWWYVVNSTAIIGTGVIAYLATRGLSGWGRWPLIVLIPFGAVAVHTGVSAPVYLALYSRFSAAENLPAALITIAFSLVLLSTMARLVTVSVPKTLKHSIPEENRRSGKVGAV